MAEPGRKGLVEKAKDTVTPESSKGPLDKVQDSLSSGVDKSQRDALPDSEKGSRQSAADKLSREKEAHKEGESVLDTAKEKVGMSK